MVEPKNIMSRLNEGDVIYAEISKEQKTFNIAAKNKIYLKRFTKDVAEFSLNTVSKIVGNRFKKKLNFKIIKINFANPKTGIYMEVLPKALKPNKFEMSLISKTFNKYYYLSRIVFKQRKVQEAI